MYSYDNWNEKLITVSRLTIIDIDFTFSAEPKITWVLFSFNALKMVSFQTHFTSYFIVAICPFTQSFIAVSIFQIFSFCFHMLQDFIVGLLLTIVFFINDMLSLSDKSSGKFLSLGMTSIVKISFPLTISDANSSRTSQLSMQYFWSFKDISENTFNSKNRLLMWITHSICLSYLTRPTIYLG